MDLLPTSDNVALKTSWVVCGVKPLKFIHITKTGGTSIEDFGKKNDLLWGRFHKEYGSWSKESPGRGVWHTLFTLQESELKKQYDWFVVVRNPYDRLISEFYCCALTGKLRDPATTRQQFNDILQHNIRNRYPFGDHYSEQYLYTAPGVHVLRFETLQADFAQLMSMYGLPTKLDVRANVSKDKKFGVTDFSVETLELVNSVYQKDFEQFGYTMLIPKT